MMVCSRRNKTKKVFSEGLSTWFSTMYLFSPVTGWSILITTEYSLVVIISNDTCLGSLQVSNRERWWSLQREHWPGIKDILPTKRSVLITNAKHP